MQRVLLPCVTCDRRLLAEKDMQLTAKERQLASKDMQLAETGRSSAVAATCPLSPLPTVAHCLWR